MRRQAREAVDQGPTTTAAARQPRHRRRARPRGVPAGARAGRPGVSETGELFLGIIAFAVMVMALIQVGAIFAGIRLARRVDQLATQLDQEIKPLIANLTTLSSEAARAAALAARQAERLDASSARWWSASTRRCRRPEFVTGPPARAWPSWRRQDHHRHVRSLREASRRRTASRPVVEEEESLSSASVLNGWDEFHLPQACSCLSRCVPCLLRRGRQETETAAPAKELAQLLAARRSTALRPACQTQWKNSWARFHFPAS